MSTILRRKAVSCAQMLLLTVLCAGLVPCNLRAAEEPGRDVGALLPEDTILFVRLGAWKECAGAWHETALAQIAAEPEIRACLAGPLAKLGQLLKQPAEPPPAAGAKPGILTEKLAALADWATGPLTVAATYSGEDAKAQRRPAVAVILGVRDDAPVLEKLKMLDTWLPEKSLKRETYQGVPLFTCTSEVPITGTYTFRATSEVTFACTAKHLLVTSRPDLCKRLMDGLSNTAAHKLSERPAFQLSGLTGREQMCAFLDIEAVRNAFRAEEAKSGKLKDFIAAAGLEHIQAMGWSLQMNGPAFESRTAIVPTAQREGLLGALDSQPLTADAFRACPPNGPIAVGVRVKSDRIVEILRGMFRIAGGPESGTQFALLEKKEGRKLADQASAALSGELVLTSYAGKEDLPVVNPRRTLVAALPVQDGPKAEKLMLDLVKGLAQIQAPEADVNVQELPYEGATIRYVKMAPAAADKELKFALVEKTMLVALDVRTLKAAISTCKAKGLSATPEFQKAVQDSGGQLGALVAYIDWGWFFTSAYNFGLRTLDLLPSQGLIQKVGLDVNRLPAAETVTKHLFPALLVAQASDKAVIIKSRSPLPSLEVLAPPAAALTALIASFLPEPKDK